MSQSLIQLQQTDIQPQPGVQEMQFWLEKVVVWGQSDSADTRKDTCLHLSRLRDFLQQLLTHINNTVSRSSNKLNARLHSFSLVNFLKNLRRALGFML